MLFSLLDIVSPVFLLVLLGYVLVKRGMFDTTMIDGLMKFAVQVAIPCLLFRATATIDLGQAYDWPMMAAFYGGAAICFAVASTASRKWFARRPGEAVAVGFGALFSNLVLLGLPILERALGEAAMPTAYAVVSLHAPFCYLLGIVSMECLRADGRSWRETTRVVASTLFRNNLMIGIGLGFLVNFSTLELPGILLSTFDLLIRAALPVALFALGGVLTRYTLADEVREAGMISAISLVLHPSLVLVLCLLFGVSDMHRQIVVLMAAMSPGVNAYLFASLYRRGEGTAASTVLLSTLMAVVTVSLWLWLLHPVP